MAKSKTAYVCDVCGFDTPKWVGKCPSCGNWNTMKEFSVGPVSPSRGAAVVQQAGLRRETARPVPLSEIDATEEPRLDTHDAELNRVLGGGIVPGSLILLGGEPGIGKSTLLLQTVLGMSDRRILYVSGEESERQIKLRADRQEVVLSVDKAYWQVVSLTHKARLATAYRDMLQHLDSDVQKMVKEGVATRSNALAVSVELNKAEMTLTRAEDGLTLSRMLLAQLCGLPLDAPVHLADEQLTDLPASTATVKADVATAMGARPELRQLDLAQSIYGEKVKIERAAFLPTLALTGGYGMTYPSMFNGFEKKLKGTWSVGLLLKVPIWEWGEGKHKVAAAKADAAVAGLQLQEAREKITLQVNQTALAVNQAVKKLGLTEKSQSRAEENLRMARVGFKEGVVTTSDLLAAQTAWLAAQSDKIDAQIDIMITRAIYEKALGR